MDQDPGATVHRGYPRAGEYDLIRKMGAGGFGTVFEARHRATGLPYAVKRIHLTPEDAERFRNEALYPARIASESLHVLGVVSFFHDDDADAFYVVTELIAHGDLRAFLDRHPKPLPLALGLDVGLGIAKGLAAIHAQQIVHRDLKPANVLMDRKDGQWIAKIADFGLARSVSSVSIAQFATSGYAAPEQLDLLTDVPLGPESDLFSYGMVLYELLTGEKPTAAVGLKEYGRWLAARVPPPVPSRVRPELAAWPELDHLIGRLLDFNRATRLASADDVVRVLDGVRHPAAPPPPPALQRVPLPAPLPAPIPAPPPIPPPVVDPQTRGKTEPQSLPGPGWRLRLAMVPVFAATGVAMFCGLPWQWVEAAQVPFPVYRFRAAGLTSGYGPWLLTAAIVLPALFGVGLALAERLSWRRVLVSAGLAFVAYDLACLFVIATKDPLGSNVAVIGASAVGALALLVLMAVLRRRRPTWLRIALVAGTGLAIGGVGLAIATDYYRTFGDFSNPLAFALWQIAIGSLLVEPPAGDGRPRWWPLVAFGVGTAVLSVLASQ
jgi:serine/threonine protein kinase